MATKWTTHCEVDDGGHHDGEDVAVTKAKVEATAAGWVATIRDMVMAYDLVGRLIVR